MLILGTFEEYLTKVVKDYNGPLLNIVATGGGTAISHLLSVPGSSRVVYGITCPYHAEAMQDFLRKPSRYYAKKAVSADAAWEMARAASKDGVKTIAITGAITTSRYRRGNNEAFFCIGEANVNHVYHVSLDKLPEGLYSHQDGEIRDLLIAAARSRQDAAIAMAALSIATGIEREGDYHVAIQHL